MQRKKIRKPRSRNWYLGLMESRKPTFGQIEEYFREFPDADCISVLFFPHYSGIAYEQYKRGEKIAVRGSIIRRDCQERFEGPVKEVFDIYEKEIGPYSGVVVVRSGFRAMKDFLQSTYKNVTIMGTPPSD